MPPPIMLTSMLSKLLSYRRVPPAALAVGAGLAQLALARGRRPSPGALLAAGALATASAGLIWSSVAAFRNAGTTVDPLAVERAESLVTTGVFNVTRNPMYVGMAGFLLAHSVLRRSGAGILPVGLFVVVLDQLQIPAEEQALRTRFGHAFSVYRLRVPRWLSLNPGQYLR